MDDSDSDNGNPANDIMCHLRHGLPPKQAGGCVFLRF